VIARRRALLLAVPIVLGSALLVSVPGETAASKRLTIDVTQDLQPAYRPSVPDYTVRCKGGKVTFRASVPAGKRVAVDGADVGPGEVRRDIPLAPGQGFRFSVGDNTHEVRCVPADFPRWRVEGHGVPRVQWLVFAPDQRQDPPRGGPYSVIADRDGVPVWWARAAGASPVNARLLPDRTVTWARLGGRFSQTYWDHVKLDGTALPPFRTAEHIGADHHDFTPLPGGDHLMIVYRPRRHVDLRSIGGPRDATVFDGVVQELTPKGKLVWKWSTKGHVRLRETAIEHAGVDWEGKTAYDLVHMNSVAYSGPDLIFSGKGVNAVYRVRRSSGKILWKLGGTHRRESLRFKRDPYGQEPFGAQHDARILPDGTLTVHDNGEFLHARFPRIARYRIDTRKRTATLVEEVRDKRLIQSYCCGSGTRLAGGRWLIAWGSNSIITELSAGTGESGHEPIFTIELPNQLFTYRVQGVAPGLVSREALRAAMDAMHPRR
jgi:hypothetical protein